MDSESAGPSSRKEDRALSLPKCREGGCRLNVHGRADLRPLEQSGLYSTVSRRDPRNRRGAWHAGLMIWILGGSRVSGLNIVIIS